MWVDKPGEWLVVNGDGETEKVDVRESTLRLLDLVFNPEYKEWTYKSESGESTS